MPCVLSNIAVEVYPLSDDEDFGYCPCLAVRVAGKDKIDSAGHFFPFVGTTIPDGLASIGRGTEDTMPGGIGDVHDGIAAETFDSDGTIIVRPHRIGESMYVFTILAGGIDSGAAVTLQTRISADKHLAGDGIHRNSDNFVA